MYTPTVKFAYKELRYKTKSRLHKKSCLFLNPNTFQHLYFYIHLYLYWYKDSFYQKYTIIQGFQINKFDCITDQILHL